MMANDRVPVNGEGPKERIAALVEAYEPGNYALADGVCHVYYEVQGSTGTLREDLRFILAEADELSTLRAQLSEMRIERDRLREALLSVQKLIAEAAMTGFNCHDGEWPTKLFESQRQTSRALASTSQDSGTADAFAKKQRDIEDRIEDVREEIKHGARPLKGSFKLWSA